MLVLCYEMTAVLQLLCRLLECACHHGVSVPGVDKLLHSEIAWLQQVKVGEQSHEMGALAREASTGYTVRHWALTGVTGLTPMDTSNRERLADAKPRGLQDGTESLSSR